MSKDTIPAVITSKGLQAEVIAKLFQPSNLKEVSTEELIRELESRPGVKKISVGLHQPYELKRKYCEHCLSDEEVYVEAKEVLVIQDASVRDKGEHLPDEVEAVASEMAKTLGLLDNKIDEMKLGKEFESYTGKLASLIFQISRIQASYQNHSDEMESVRRYWDARDRFIKSMDSDVKNAKLNINSNLIQHHQDSDKRV